MMSRQKEKQRRILAPYLVLLAALLATVTPAGAVVNWCVNTELGIQNALDFAAINNQDDVIRIARDTYDSSQSPHGYFYYDSNQADDLTIEGDWLHSPINGCYRNHTPSPAFTTIDGEGTVPGMILILNGALDHLVTVRYLTFANGYYSGTSGSTAGGLSVWGFATSDPSVVIEGNAFVFNQAPGASGGLVASSRTMLRVVNNLFAINTTGWGHGAASLTGNSEFPLIGPNVEIYNNTVVYNNTSGTGDGGLRIGGNSTYCNVDNNIFWGNGGPDLIVDNSNCTLKNNDIEDPVVGTPASNENALSVYPEWAGYLFNYRLAPDSPLLNQGIVRWVNNSMPDYDLDGLPRFSSESPVDIGAYEFQYIFYDDFEDGTTDAWSSVSP